MQIDCSVCSLVLSRHRIIYHYVLSLRTSSPSQHQQKAVYYALERHAVASVAEVNLTFETVTSHDSSFAKLNPC